jgi:5-methylcytosine-specific restriction endonuclease McrA
MKICMCCGSSRSIEDEHVRAVSKGGARTIPACQDCNRSKGDKPLMEWLRWLRTNDSYRWNKIKNYNFGKKNDIAKKVHIVRDESKS